ncbi:hypothetical protein WCLP8_90001 [uncultured Gammaproteobacteria bacterium]
MARKGRVYVSDTVTHSVMMLDPANGTHKEIGTESPGLLGKPLGLDLDGQGNLYVADVSRKWAMMYDQDGKYLQGFGRSVLLCPTPVATNPDLRHRRTRLRIADHDHPISGCRVCWLLYGTFTSLNVESIYAGA